LRKKRLRGNIWETLNNPDFKGGEFDSFKNEAGYKERVLRLNKIAIQQMTVLAEVQGRKLLT
jgi:hypothetical protein